MRRFLEFKVKVPANGADGKSLNSRGVALYIKEAIENWSGQYNPDEDNMFYWCKDKTKVSQIRKRKT
jgi:hypothetical protein